MREAVLNLSRSPDWPVYQDHLQSLVTDWGQQALTPGLPYEQTEALRQARIRVEMEILPLPVEARKEEEELKNERPE